MPNEPEHAWNTRKAAHAMAVARAIGDGEVDAADDDVACSKAEEKELELYEQQRWNQVDSNLCTKYRQEYLSALWSQVDQRLLEPKP